MGDLKLKLFVTPNTNDVEKYIIENYKIGEKILHIVPTLILFRRRSKQYRSKLGLKLDNKSLNYVDREITQKLIDKNIYLFEFNRFLEYFVYKSDYRVLTKRESSIVLERIMKSNKKTNNYTWKSVLYDVHEAFQYFSASGISMDKLVVYSQTDSWKTLMRLYEQYKQELNIMNVYDFGIATNKVINSKVMKDFDKVYIDGAFLPIEPALNKLIENLHEAKIDISFFLPFDPTNSASDAFRVLKKTYEKYVPMEKWDNSLIEKPKDEYVVEKVARNIFSDNTIEISDLTLQIFEYATPEEEINDVVKKAVEQIKRGVVKQKDIAIVTPNPIEMRPIIRDVIELYNVKADTPERPLIQLPLGKLIYTLYQIFIDERIDVFENNSNFLDVQMVTDILQTKLIKDSYEIIDVFEKIQVFFEDCTNFENWFNQINVLINAKKELEPKYVYHPLNRVTLDDLIKFKEYLTFIKNFSTKIFNVSNMTFKNHLKKLFNQLENEPRIKKFDNIIKNRIINIVESSDTQENLKINIREFASRIHSIFIDNNREPIADTDNELRLTVTGSNNIEYQDYDYIYLIQFNQSNYPEKKNYSWPMSLELEYLILKNCTRIGGNGPEYLRKYYLERALYYFYIVLNSTRKGLKITFPRVQNGIEQSPAHYINDIVKIFGIRETDEKKILKTLQMNSIYFDGTSNSDNKELDRPNSPSNLNILDDSKISIEEVAAFEYCPRRFYYEIKFPEEKIYTDSFQLQLYATSCLYEEAVKILVNRFPEVEKFKKKRILYSLDEIINQAQEKVKTYFPVGQRYWEDIILRTRAHLESLLNNIFQNTKDQKANLNIDKGQYVSKNVGRYEFTGVRELKVSYETSRNRYYPITNLQKLLSLDATVLDKGSKEHLSKVKNSYLTLLSEFCYEKPEAIAKLESYSEKIYSSDFNKNPGGHCHYCAFKQFCMEKEIDNHEIHR